MRGKLAGKKELTPGVWEMSFGTQNSGFSFQAGQYIRLVLPKLDADDTLGPARLFSIASSPNDKEKITIAFRISESGYKKTLLAMPVGAEAEIEGSFGSFALPRDTKKTIVLIAGGTGIAPFLSMLRYAAEEKLPHNFLLLYASRNKNNCSYLPELQTLKRGSIPKLKISFATGPIQEPFIRKHLPKDANALYYVSGPPPMVTVARSILRNRGVPGETIYFEDWDGSDFLCPMTRQMLDMHTDGFFLTNLSGVIQYANPAWEKLSGWSASEVVWRRTPRILKSGKQSREYYEEVWKNHMNGKVFRKDVIDKRKNGTLYDVDHLYLPIFSEAKQIIGFAAFQRNISEEKFRQYEQTKAILAGLGEGVAVIDPAGNITTVNKMFEDLFGTKQAIGKPHGDVCAMLEGGKPVAPEEEPIALSLKRGEQISANRYSCKTASGKTIPVALTVSPIAKEGAISGAVAVFRDITREKEIEKVRQDFLSLASHQLRTPLSGTKWLIETMRRGVLGAVGKEQKEYINQLYAINERMIRLVSDMLNVLRIESGGIMIKKETVSVARLCEAICALMAPVIKETNPVILQNALEGREDITLETDAAIVQTILESLVSNAISYSPAKKTVTLGARKENSAVIFSVRDEGIGIPQDERTRIFERFYRASNAKEFKPNGTGLGLYTASVLAEKIGANISFESEEGEGSVFYLRIPKENG